MRTELHHRTDSSSVRLRGNSGQRYAGTRRFPLGNHDSQELFRFEPHEVDAAYSEVVKLKMGRATSWETAYAALYLLADESRFMTGQQIRLDGGATLVR